MRKTKLFSGVIFSARTITEMSENLKCSQKDCFEDLQFSSSSSYELFVVSIMQEDVYIDYTAFALTLGLQVFS